MNPRKLAMIAAIGGTVIAVRGITSKKWTEAHNILLLLAVIAFLGGGGTAGVKANL